MCQNASISGNGLNAVFKCAGKKISTVSGLKGMYCGKSNILSFAEMILDYLG